MKKYFLAHKVLVFKHVLACLLAAGLMVGNAFVIQGLTSVALSQNLRQFVQMALFAVVFLIVEAYFDYVPRVTKAKAVQSITASLRQDLLRHDIETPLAQVEAEASSLRVSRLVNELAVIEESYLKPIFSCILTIFTFVFSLIAALWLQSQLTLLMVSLSFIPLLAPLINQRVLANKKQISVAAQKNLLGVYEEIAVNLSTIRLRLAGSAFTQRFQKVNQQLAFAKTDFEGSQGKTYAISYGLSNIVYSGTWIIGGFFVFQDWLTLPELIAMTALMSTIAGPIQMLSEYVSDLSASRKVVTSFLQTIQPAEKITGEPLKETIHTIELRNVTYGRGERQILSHLSYTFFVGKRYAIIGESGVGKSTLLSLILGIQNATNVFVNNQAIAALDKADYWQQIAYVPQKTAIFEGTLSENITLFQKGDPIQLAQALKRAGLANLLEELSLSGNLDAVRRLSGGEERRLDIARALYRKTPVLILDEPTTGLDRKNERAIGELLTSLEEQLVIAVTHSRDSEFLKNFDVVLELQAGVLKEHVL